MVSEIITAIVTLVITIFGKNFWDSRKASDINRAKVEMKELELRLKQAQTDHKESETLIEQNKQLIQKINHLEVIIEKANSSFEMLITLLKEEFKGKPHIIEAFDQISSNLKKKQ